MNSHHTFSSLAGKLWWLGLVLLSLSWSAVAGGASSREGGDHEGNAPTVAFTVDSPADAVDANPGNGVCATATGECTLRAAVQETNALPGADTIVVPAGTYRLTIAGANEDAAATGDLDIRANLNLVGAGSQQTIIDGDGQVTGDRVFHLLFQDIYVTVSDLTVRGGVSGANGGGFYSRSHLTLQSVRVLANQANWGGGIWNTGTLIINDSLVRDNHATGRGGGLYTEYNPATINHTTFAVNTADDGGGLFSFSSALTIEDCHLTGNTAVDQGGGLYQDLSASGLNNTSFAGNAAAYGGALYNESATLTISNSSLYQNTATGDGGAVYEGGYPNSPHLILTASMVASNTAGGSGGGIFNGGDFIDAILEVTNSTISGNTAGSNGGGIYHWGDLKVIHTTITGNTATLEGGGFYRWDGPVNFKGNVIAGNTAATFPDCRGSVYSAGYNLIGILSGCGINTNTGDQYGSESNPIDPRLGPLADNGGLTRTHAPYHDSPAVDAGDPAGCTDLAGNLVAADQRDFVRPVDGNVDGSEVCDLGAVELGSAASRDFSLYASPEEVELCAPSPAVYDLLVFSVLGFDTPVNLAASGQPAGTTVTFDPDPITPGSAASLTVGNTSAAEAGNYTISIGGQALTHTHTIEVGLALRNQTPGNAELRRPPDGANQVLLRPTFVWWAATQADSYTLEVATDDDFNNVVYSVTMDLTRHTMATSLLPQTLYFWRVRTHNVCGDDSQPAVFRFTTDRLPPFIVNSTADAVDNAPGDGVCATATNECTLRAAVQEANAAATSDTVVIRLPSGTYILTLVGADEDAAATGDLDITGKVAILGVTEQGAAGHRQESLTVAGNPVIIDGNGLVTGDRVFHILDGGRASLDSLTIQGGRGNNGGAILNSGVLTLTAGLLTVNEATGYGFVGGGALYSNGTATIINTTLSDNTASDRAGAIYNDTGTLTLDSSVITGNTAEYGGGLFTLWGITTITNSTISYNSSNHTGGGIYADNGSFTLAQSLLNGNTAVTDGGGIWDYNAPAYINNSTVTANSANGNGGGIYVNGLYGPGAAILNNATVTNNWAIGAGGGTYNYFGTVLLKNSILALNTTPEATPDCAGGVTSEGYNVVGDSDGCGYIASVGDQVGDSDNPLDPRLGPLQDNGGPTLTQALLADSPAVDAGRPTGCKDYFGRRLLTDQRGYQRVIDGDLDGQDVCDAGAYEYGSAGQPDFGLYTIPDLVDVCTLADGAASVYATSLLGFHSPLTLSASGQPAGSTVSFAPNPLTPPGPSAMTISDTGSAPPDRYLVEVTAAAPTRTHSTTLTLDLSAVTPSQPLLLTPADNALAQSARPLFTWQAVESYATYDLEIALDPAFSQIVESAYGLDSPSYTPAAGLRLLTTYYWRVQARNGCGVSPYSAVFHFTTWDGRMGVDSTLDAVDTSPGDGVCAAGGVCTLRAAVQEANAQKTADPLTITLPAGTYRLTIPGEWENEAATGDLDVTSNLVIEGAAEQGSKGAGENSALSIIDGNNAVTGDRVFHIPDDGRLTLRGVTVQGGRTSTGGGIYSNGTLTITQSTVTGNTSYGLLFAGGGGIYNTGQLIVEDSVITTNHADDRGGAIYSIGAAADTTLRRVDVIDNSSNYGGAFFMELGVFTMEDTVIDDNALGRAGGGFYLSSTSGVIRRSTVRSNFSNDEGGGMAVYNTTLTIEDSTLSDNEAYEDGGAMAVYNSTLTIINSTFSGNHAYNDWGGAIYASGSTVDLSSVTITGNTAISGGGMKHDGNLMTLRNTLVAGNSATNYGPDCRGDITLAGYNLIQVTDDCTLLGDLTGLLTNVSPVLGGLQNNGGNTETHALLAGSPAIDAGNPAGCADAGGNELATDQRGYDRHADGDENGTFICDLGAYEYTSAPAPDFTLTAAPTSQSLCAPAEAVYDLTLESILGFSESVTLSARGQPAGTAATFTSNPVVPPDSSQLTIGNTSAANYGSYTIVVSGTAASASHSASVGLTLYTAVPQPPVLQSPTNGATYVARQPAFTWQAAVQGRTYYLEVAADPSFTNVVYSATVTGTSHTATTVLAARTLHYWRVRAENTCGLGGYSAVFSFTTAPTDFSLVATPGEQSICAPAEAVYNVVVSGESDPVTLSTSGVPAGATATFSVNPVYTPGDSVLTIGNTGAAADGRYGISIVGQTPEYTHDTTVILNLNTTAPPPPTLLTPADGTNNQTLQPLFTWEAAGAGAIYDLEVATDSSFNNVVITATGLTEASYTPSAYLTFDTTYFWRVRSSNACGSGAYSVVYAFTTWSGVLAVNDTGDQVDANPGDGLCEAGPGVCTLRAAVQEANASAGNGTVTINLPAGTFKLRRAGVGEDYAAAGDLDIRVHVTIQGAGPDLTIIDANSVVTGDRVFHLPVATAAATLAGVTLENGHGTGGGIHNSGSVTLTQVIVTQNDVTAIQNYGDLFIVDSHITNNSGVYGGAINSSGDLTVLRSTISNNDADTTGGALYHNGNTAVFDSSIISGNSAYWAGGLQSFDGTLTLINSTVSGNTGVEGGGVRVDGGTAYINNSTLTGNSATNGGGFQGDGGTTTLSNSILAGNSATIGLDCQGPLASAGYNLLGNDAGCAFSAYTGDQIGSPELPLNPLLGPLQDNGGPTFTHALLEGSPAIETGNPAGCVDDQGHLLTVDQRGYVRPIDADADGAAICDVGAFEYGSTFQPDFSLAVTPVAAGICLPGQATYQIDVTPLLGFSQAVGLSASGQPVGVTTSFDPNPVTPPGSSALTLTAAPSAPSGRYDLALTGQTITRTHTITAALELFGGPSEPPALLTPADGAIDQPLRPTFTWSAAGEPPSVVTYDLEIATDSSFNNIILAAPGLVEAIYTPTADLQREALYYWRVRASNSCGSGGYSTVFSFTTAAGDLIVDSTADGVDTNPGDGLCLTVAGTCTLRAAVQEANATPGNERREIVLPAGLYTLTRTGSGEDAAATGDLDITGNVTILGMEGTRETERAFPSSLSSSSSLSVTIDASTMNDRVFHVLAGGRLSLSLVAVSGGRADNGGGVYNSGTLTVTQSTLSGNTSTATLLAGGGAVYNSGQLVVRSSTLSSNVSGDRGGGLYNTGSSPTATIENSTISGNSAGHAGAIFGDTGSITVYDSTVTENLASRDGGGLYELNASMTLRNTVWAGNVALSHGDDCWGGMSSAGYNLLGTNEYCAFASSIGDDVGTPGNEIDPLLGPLQNNGGPTWTHALLPYSWAIDRGHPGYCPTTDQRGVARPQGAGCDKGAFELEALPLTCRSPGLAIPDNDPAGASDDLLLTDSGAITDLNVSLQVAHTWVGDLVFTLTHVDTGTSVTIIDRPGLPPPPSCNGDDIDATLDDEAADPVENACAPTTPTILGVFVPNGSLAGFDGEDLAGTWRLTAADLAQSDVGALTQWCVIATR